MSYLEQLLQVSDKRREDFSISPRKCVVVIRPQLAIISKNKIESKNLEQLGAEVYVVL